MRSGIRHKGGAHPPTPPVTHPDLPAERVPDGRRSEGAGARRHTLRACTRSPARRILAGMSGGTDNLVLEMLRAIRGDIAEMRAEQREQRARIGAIERAVAHLEREQAELRAEIGARFDRVLDRLDRIERRLDLADHPAG